MLLEKDNFRVFAANGKQKRKISVCFLQKANGILFSLVGKDKSWSMLAVSANVPIYVIMYNMEVHMHKCGHLQF